MPPAEMRKAVAVVIRWHWPHRTGEFVVMAATRGRSDESETSFDVVEVAVKRRRLSESRKVG